MGLFSENPLALLKINFVDGFKLKEYFDCYKMFLTKLIKQTELFTFPHYSILGQNFLLVDVLTLLL